MRHRVATALALVCLLFSSALAQERAVNRKPKEISKAAAQSGPVTNAEVDQIFAEVEAIMTRVVTAKPAGAMKKAGDPKAAATREYIIGHMNRLFESARSKFKITPKPVNYRPGVLSITATSPARAQLEKLIKFGFVGKVAPLATASKNQMGLEQFGDAVGLFVARIADLTHSPDPAWSPYIGGGGG